MANKKNEPQDELTQVGVKGISASVVQKLQVIAGLEGVASNDVYKVALETYVKLYEKQHGKLPIKPKGGGLNVL